MKEPSREIFDMFLKTGPVFFNLDFVDFEYIFYIFCFVTCPLDPISNGRSVTEYPFCSIPFFRSLYFTNFLILA